MKISSRVEYGINALIDIAISSENGATITAQQIAQKHNFSIKFLEQILASLRLNKFICAEKGRFGGYYLAKKSELITLTNIIEILDDSILSNAESDIHNSFRENNFVLDEIFQNINICLSNYTDNITLKELCEINDFHNQAESENGYMYYI